MLFNVAQNSSASLLPVPAKMYRLLHNDLKRLRPTHQLKLPCYAYNLKAARTSPQSPCDLSFLLSDTHSQPVKNVKTHDLCFFSFLFFLLSGGLLQLATPEN